MGSHSYFSARTSSTREQLFRADELPKMALERKKQTGSCLTFFQMKKINPDQLVLIGMGRVKESLMSFYNKSPMMITHCSPTLYHRGGGSDVAFHFSSINKGSCGWYVLFCASGDLWVETIQGASQCFCRSPVLGFPGEVESCKFIGLTLDLLIWNLRVRLPRCHTESRHPQGDS